jgi:hypothetical protein
VTKETKGRRRRTVPIIDPLRPTLVRLTAGRRPEERLVLGPRGGVITTATLRDATGWDALVTELGQPGLVRHGLPSSGTCRRCHPFGSESLVWPSPRLERDPGVSAERESWVTSAGVVFDPVSA